MPSTNIKTKKFHTPIYKKHKKYFNFKWGYFWPVHKYKILINIFRNNIVHCVSIVIPIISVYSPAYMFGRPDYWKSISALPKKKRNLSGFSESKLGYWSLGMVYTMD